MKRVIFVKTVLICIAFVFIVIGENTFVYAQLKPSFSVAYESYPYSKLVNPSTELVNGQRNFQQDLKIRVASLFINASYPLIFSQGKTVFINQIDFERFDLDYNKWNEEQGGTNRVEHAYSINYNMIFIRQLARRWSLMTMIIPGLASDLEDDLDKNDFNLQLVAIFTKQFRETFSMGYGLAYSTAFGQPVPFPVISVNWNNGSNLQIESILPVNVELTYLPIKSLALGLIASVDGNQFHGAESNYIVEGIKNPQLRYSVATLGPTLKWRIAGGLQLLVSGGMTFLRRFEYYDGNDEKDSYDLKGSGFIKAGFLFGG